MGQISNMQKLYEQVYNGKHIPIVRLDEIYNKSITNSELKPPASKAQIAAKISAIDKTVTVKAGKDIRLQPVVGEYSAEKLYDTLKLANLQVVDVKKPGTPGSTSSQLTTYIVRDEGGNEYPVVVGKGKGFGTRAEDSVIASLADQIDSLLAKNGTDNIIVNINGYKQKVDGVASTPGTPKSDFSLTYKGKPVLFISHKDGKSAKDYQQYGGTSCQSGQNICNDTEVKRFVSKLKKLYPDGMTPKSSVYMKIKNPDLKKFAIFGTNANEAFGINNVNAVYQGDLKLVKIGKNEFEIQSKHHIFPDELPEGDYEPVLYARYSGSRGGNHGIKDLRSMIAPIAKITSKTKQL